MQELAVGKLKKMATALQQPVQYHMVLDEQQIPLTQFLGKTLQLRYQGQINCLHCDRKTNKSFNQGFCYPCFKRLAQCDSCIVSPEKCHFHAGTCREPEWAEQHCMTDHFVYLANTSGLKVGITRGSQIPTRWMDQGATQAVPIFRVQNRLLSGLVEVLFKEVVADKTHWQAMLKADAEPKDMAAERERLLQACTSGVEQLQQTHGLQSITVLGAESVTDISYPVLQFPSKVKSMNFDKTELVEGQLQGIKGQYLIFDTGVINMRKFGGYQVSLSA